MGTLMTGTADPVYDSYRYIIRSKDRISGQANNFTVQLPHMLPETYSEFYVKLTVLSCGAYPAVGSYAVQNGSIVGNAYTTTSQNQDPNPTLVNVLYQGGTGGTTPSAAPAQISQAWGFDSSGVVDLCIDFKYSDTVDSETCKYQAAPTLSTGTAYAAGNKVNADKTFLTIPYARGELERALRLWYERPWIKIQNPNNLVNLTVKLFNDKGSPLQLKSFFPTSGTYYSTAPIDDWSFELVLVPASPLNHHGFPKL